jgi:hypothetical protein
MYVSDPLDENLRIGGIDLIVPGCMNRFKPEIQGSRELQRYRHLWKIVRLNIKLQNYRRLQVGSEHRLEITLAFLIPLASFHHLSKCVFN